MPAPDRFPAVVVDHERSEPVSLRELAHTELTGELLVEVSWSSLNYKDALASRPDGQVARISPLVLGVDQVGTVRESGDPHFAPGDIVLAHGRDLGVSHHGGLAAWSRVPADWAVTLPAGLGAREAMILGTAGYTVHASTGKADAAAWLRELGADEVLDREAVSGHASRALSKQLFAATVDSVGGATLAGALAATRYGGAVAASGLTGGAALETTVMPFILRSVALLGIDSSATDSAARGAIWERIATDLRPARLDLLVAREIGLGEVIASLGELLAGNARGRFVVRIAT